MATTTTNSAAADPVNVPSEGVRTLVSLLVFAHLFALLVGVFSSEIPSQLQIALARVPLLRQYRQVLGMELPYSYYFTRGNEPGGELDIDYTLSATVKSADGSTETVDFPSPNMWPHQRYHRYQTLAARVAQFSSENAPEPRNLELLMQSVAGGLMREYHVQAVDLRCRGQLTPPAMDEFQPAQDTRENFRPAYEGRAFLADGQVELLKKEPARDTAPPPHAQ